MAAVTAALLIAFAFTYGGTLFGAPDADADALAEAQAAQVYLASLETDVAPEAASIATKTQPTMPPATGRITFGERFSSSFGDPSSSFRERFGRPTENKAEPTPPAAQGLRTAAAELDGDGAARPEKAPQRQNVRLASLTPSAGPAADTRPSPNRPMDAGNRTAVYDISARLVYLPNGEKLEAHSGLGSHMDDVRTAAVKMKGVTPPNVYDLTLRERPFHGVRAIRLNPVDSDKMYGRAGILAHSYMLGPNGQSNGCVSISDYPRFLNAFLNGEIDRLVVVERLEDTPATNWLADRIKAFFKSS